MYLAAYLKAYNGILASYNQLNEELLGQYIGLQQKRDGLKVDIKAEQTVTLADDMRKDIATTEAALVRLTEKISAHNKNFIDLVGRMGVPTATTDDDKGSHTPSPQNTIYEDMGSGAVDTEAKASLVRQLEYFDTKEVSNE